MFKMLYFQFEVKQISFDETLHKNTKSAYETRKQSKTKSLKYIYIYILKRIYIVTKKYIPLEKIHTSIQMQLQTKEERRTGVQNFINFSSLPVTQAEFFSKAPLKEENFNNKEFVYTVALRPTDILHVTAIQLSVHKCLSQATL